LVDEYERDDDGRYKLAQWDVEFSQYLNDQVLLTASWPLGLLLGLELDGSLTR